MPINFNIDSVRWYFHLTGKHPNLSERYLEVKDSENYKDCIVIMRSLRRQNEQINYSFLSKYKNLFYRFKNEFDELKNK